MKHKAGLHKQVSSIFKDLNMTDDEPTTGEAKAPTDAGGAGALSTEHRETPPPADADAPQTQPDRADPPIAEKRHVKAVQHRPSKSKNKLMTKRVRIAAAIILLATVLVIVGVNMFGGVGSTLSAGAENGPADRASAFERKIETIDWQMPRKLPQPIRDVMSPEYKLTTSRPGQLQELVVRGILYSADRPSAIIGTQIERVGDEIMGTRVIGITRRTVEFEKDGQTWTQDVGHRDVP